MLDGPESVMTLDVRAGIRGTSNALLVIAIPRQFVPVDPA